MIRPPNHLRFIRNILYRLKRDWGSLVDIYNESADTVDLMTGNRTVTKSKWTVRRGICLPSAIHRDSILASAMKNVFEYGGTLQLGDKTVLLDRRDLPKGFKLGTENWYMVIDSLRYEIVRVEEYENQAAYLVVLKHTTGTQVAQFVDMKVRDRIGVTTEADGATEP